MPAIAMPSRCHPVSNAISVKLREKCIESAIVLADKIGESVVAMTESTERIMRMRSASPERPVLQK